MLQEQSSLCPLLKPSLFILDEMKHEVVSLAFCSLQCRPPQSHCNDTPASSMSSRISITYIARMVLCISPSGPEVSLVPTKTMSNMVRRQEKQVKCICSSNLKENVQTGVLPLFSSGSVLSHTVLACFL